MTTGYLTVCGVDVPVAASSSPTRTRVYVGTRGNRTFNGAPRDMTRATSWDLKGRTVLSSASDSEALRSLVEGRGEVWSFDTDATGSRGTIPSAYGGPGGTSPTVVTTGGKWGGYLSMPYQTYVSYDLGLDTNWTVLAWAKLSTTSTWTWYCYRSNAGTLTLCKNGTLTTSAPNVPPLHDVTVGVATLGPTFFDFSASTWHMDGLVILPYVVPDAWVSQLYAYHSAGPFAPLPYVAVGGRMPQGRVTKAMGSITDAQQMDFGSLYESFDFVLAGVP